MKTAFVILAHATDSGAESVVRSLVERHGFGAVLIVRPETLSAASWSHRVTSTGRASTRLTLPGSEPLEDTRVAAVLNRIRYLPVPRFHRASAKDRDYAGAEMQALVASWLAGLGKRVVHVVREHPWLTPMLPLQHWAHPAASCGLPVATRAAFSSSSLASQRVDRDSHTTTAEPGPIDNTATTILVAGNRVDGQLAGTFGQRCLRTARLLGFPLLEFQFATQEGRAVLTHVEPMPSLHEPWATSLTIDLLETIAAGSPS
ncbi:MAG TPA: hypothetical protein VMS40_07925 [Vicinamibacterales bacterium]|nr:hypothetical protein [Vicinamibacterales bacterium]